MRGLIAISAAWVLVVCSGCGDSYESLTGEGVAVMKKGMK